MLNKIFIYLLLTAFMLNSAIAIGMNDDESYEEESEGELVERYVEEYIDIQEAKALGLKLKKVKVEKQEHHDKLEQTKISSKKDNNNSTTPEL